jgi:hypothetical protein
MPADHPGELQARQQNRIEIHGWPPVAPGDKMDKTLRIRVPEVTPMLPPRLVLGVWRRELLAKLDPLAAGRCSMADLLMMCSGARMLSSSCSLEGVAAETAFTTAWGRHAAECLLSDARYWKRSCEDP